MARKLGVRHWQLYVLILPALVYLVIFCYLPMYGVVVAFQNYNPVFGVFDSPWVGWGNFKSLFQSYWFEIMLVNTLELSLYSLPVNTVFVCFLFAVCQCEPNVSFFSIRSQITIACTFTRDKSAIEYFIKFYSLQTALSESGRSN